MRNNSSGDRFIVLARRASVATCGILGGFLYCVRRVNPSLEFDPGPGAVVCAFLAAWACHFLWTPPGGNSSSGDDSPTDASQQSRRRRILILAVAALSVGLLGAYAFAIKDVRRSALLEVLQGTTLALMVIGGIAIVLVKLARFLGRDTPPDGSTGVERGSSPNPYEE